MTITRALILVLLAALGAAAPSRAREGQPLVVVELFTSQGCSSCPPADTFLGELAQRPPVLALAWHVDYWNYIGWIDPYAAKFATERQRAYSHQLNMRYVYTPQMVINGTAEGVGSERPTMEPMITAAIAENALDHGLSITRDAPGKLMIHVDAGTATAPATLWLIGFDREHQTPVARGENEGKTLREFQIVRSSIAIGTWQGQALDLAVPADKAGGDGGVAVLLQENGAGRIIGAALLKPPTS